MANDARRATGSAAGTSSGVVDKKVLLAQVTEGGRLYGEGEFEKAKQIFRKAWALARHAGIASGTIEWSLAICHERLGEFEPAVEHIQAALALDPFDGAYNNSYSVIVARLRDAVAFVGNLGGDPDTERYYALLLRIGEADVAAHLVAARHLLAVGRAPEALRVLDALTVLSPSCASAWSLLAEAAAAIGDSARAHRARVEAACCRDAVAPGLIDEGKRAQA